MLKVVNVKSGFAFDFPRLDEDEDAFVKMVQDIPHVCLYLEDNIVVFDKKNSRVSAIDCFNMAVATSQIPERVANLLIAIAISDSTPYQDAEAFFADFGVRFIP